MTMPGNIRDLEHSKFIQSTSRPNGASVEYAAATTANAPTVSTVSLGTTSTTILASNSERKYVIIYNDTGKNIYIKLGAGASITSFTWKLSANAHLEINAPVYTGLITGVTTPGTGPIQVTEIT